MRPSALGRLDRLAIDNTGTRRRLAPGLHPQALSQRLHQLFPHPSIAPLAKVIIDRRPGRVLMWQQTPGPATAQHVKNPVENLTHIHTSGAASWLGWGNQRFKNGPLGIREITGIRFHGEKPPHFPLLLSRLASILPYFPIQPAPLQAAPLAFSYSLY